MKGIVFTAFLELVEKKWGLKMVDQIIGSANDPQNGAYNAINYYPHGQMVDLIMALSASTGASPDELMRFYGEHLFFDLVGKSGHLIEGMKDTFNLLENIELVIHTEVRKLYPESNPPRFESERVNDNELNLTYHSHRSMGSVAEGLILGCAKYYNENVTIETMDSNQSGTEIKFKLTKLA